MREERWKCTKENPWNINDKNIYVMHPDAIEIGDNDYEIKYLCPNCGLKFSVEMPD